MAKRSRRRSTRSQKNNAGCMWGLISLFDFRRGHPTQKLLSDKKHRSTIDAGTGYSRVKLDLLKNHPSKHDSGTVDYGIREDQVNLGLTSIKALLEEEMSKLSKKKITSNESQRENSNLQNEVHSNWNYKQRSQKRLISDNQGNDLIASAGLEGLHSDTVNRTEFSSINFDLAAILIEFYSYTRQQMNTDSNNNFDLLPVPRSTRPRSHKHDGFDSHFDQDISFFQRILSDVAQAIISQKSMVGKPSDRKWIVKHKEFIEALDIMNSDESFLKLLQDPETLRKYIQNFHSTQVRNIYKLGADSCSENVHLPVMENDNSEKCKESDNNQLFQKHNRYSFFWKKEKSKGTKPSKENASTKSLNRIVVLKPSPVMTPKTPVMVTPSSSPLSQHVFERNQNDGRIVSHFSLKEIKRRLLHIIGESRKAHHVISMDGLLHKIPVRPSDTGNSCQVFKSGSAVLSSTNRSSNESMSFASRKSEKISSEECEVNINSHISSSTTRSSTSMYKESQKHLAEMLDKIVYDLPTGQVSEPCRRVLSLPNYNELSPLSSARRDKELIMSPEETGDPSQQLNQEDIVDANMMELSIIRHDLNGEGSTETLKEIDVETDSIMCFNQFSIPTNSSTNEICEEEPAASQGMDSFEVKPFMVIQSKHPPSFINRENLVTLESTIGKQEQPSPVSVLETLLSEDITSPKSSIMEEYDIQVQDQKADYEETNNILQVTASQDVNDSSLDCFDDKQARLDYVRTLLETSGLANEFSERWDLEDHLLEPSLFDEIGIFFCFLQDDPKLLFDCINEILVEIHEKYLTCTPQMSFIKQNMIPVPLGENLIQEVSKSLESCLQIQLPNTLDRVARRDLESRSWMDLRFETENITTEICDIILEDIMEEFAYPPWFATPSTLEFII